MCKLLGVRANKAVDMEFSLLKADTPFRSLADSNPHGWGIGWYEGKEPKVYKEGISAISSQSQLSHRAKEERSHIFISHVRRGTEGDASERNSHRFEDKNWLFAHNGSVNREYLYSQLKEEFKETEGETDSEVYFHWILQNIFEEDGRVVEGVRKTIPRVIEEEFTGLNFLLSDGNSLYAFRYSRDSKHYYSLYYLRRDPADQGLTELRSKETQLLIQSKSLRGEKAVLVCSEQLTEEDWKEVLFGYLLQIDQGLCARKVKIL
jgi:glutamine amidotransferase